MILLVCLYFSNIDANLLIFEGPASVWANERTKSNPSRHSSCFSLKLSVTHLLLWLLEAVNSGVWEEALPQPSSRAGVFSSPRWALIEPADLTFVSFTLRGASAACLDHNTISTCERLTSAAQRPTPRGKQSALAWECVCCSNRELPLDLSPRGQTQQGSPT